MLRRTLARFGIDPYLIALMATVAIAAWDGDIDRERAHAVLDGRAIEPTEDDLDVLDDEPLVSKPAG